MKKLNQTNKTRNQIKAKIHKHICEGIQSVTGKRPSRKKNEWSNNCNTKLSSYNFN